MLLALKRNSRLLSHLQLYCLLGRATISSRCVISCPNSFSFIGGVSKCAAKYFFIFYANS